MKNSFVQRQLKSFSNSTFILFFFRGNCLENTIQGKIISGEQLLNNTGNWEMWKKHRWEKRFPFFDLKVL